MSNSNLAKKLKDAANNIVPVAKNLFTKPSDKVTVLSTIYGGRIEEIDAVEKTAQIFIPYIEQTVSVKFENIHGDSHNKSLSGLRQKNFSQFGPFVAITYSPIEGNPCWNAKMVNKFCETYPGHKSLDTIEGLDRNDYTK